MQNGPQRKFTKEESEKFSPILKSSGEERKALMRDLSLPEKQRLQLYVSHFKNLQAAHLENQKKMKELTATLSALDIREATLLEKDNQLLTSYANAYAPKISNILEVKSNSPTISPYHRNVVK